MTNAAVILSAVVMGFLITATLVARWYEKRHEDDDDD